MNAMAVLLNRIVAGWCPNGGLGMLHASDPPCRQACPLRELCAEVHEDRLRRAVQKAHLSKALGIN